MHAAPHERRRHTRVRYDIPVIVSEGGSIRSLTPRDISSGGVFLLADEAPPIDAPVFIELVVGRDVHLTTRARVARVVDNAGSERGFGVAFDELPGEDQARLDQAIANDPI